MINFIYYLKWMICKIHDLLLIVSLLRKYILIERKPLTNNKRLVQYNKAYLKKVYTSISKHYTIL